MNRVVLILLGTALQVAMGRVGAADATLPGPGFGGDRYAPLWTKSPFAISTPEAGATPTDLELVGVSQFDGVSYVSLIVKQTQEHFVLTSEKPVKDLTLISLNHDHNGTSAVIDRQGERLLLQEEIAPVTAEAAAGPPPSGPVSLANPSVGGMPLSASRPRVRFHRPVIVVPPPPNP